MKRLLVAGVAMRGDGYPNAERTIALLKHDAQWLVHDNADWLPPETRLWHLARGSIAQRLRLLLRLSLGGFVQAIHLIVNARAGDVAYLPYPAPLTLWWLSIWPSRWRPKCIADAYISLWDSMFRDRGTGGNQGLSSRLGRWFEARALRAADLVIVDTEANRQQFIVDFGLIAERLRSMPLAIDEQIFRNASAMPSPRAGKVRVLFVGTLVPLHGIDIVLSAAARLAVDPGIEFRLIGEGQQSGLVEAFLREGAPANFKWVREWQSLEDIAREIAGADVCLGVFGGSGKASRVLPFKLYYALAAGKPIVTQAGYSVPAGTPPLPAMLVETRSKNEAVDQLVASIRHLAGTHEEESSFGLSAQTYFERYLSGRVVKKRWEEMWRNF